MTISETQHSCRKCKSSSLACIFISSKDSIEGEVVATMPYVLITWRVCRYVHFIYEHACSSRKHITRLSYYLYNKFYFKLRRYKEKRTLSVFRNKIQSCLRKLANRFREVSVWKTDTHILLIIIINTTR